MHEQRGRERLENLAHVIEPAQRRPLVGEAHADDDEVGVFRVLAKKHGVSTKVKGIASLVQGDARLSGADIEAGLVRAKFKAAIGGRKQVSQADLQAVFKDFIPATDALAVELQALAAVLECTSRTLVPKRYRDASVSELSSRLNELKAILDH